CTSRDGSNFNGVVIYW
nr:immunoglobulin heavy chain junction region [Macaca mulatta]MOY21718.1 immunoglobulin heavy chain junction region [Macaca mulatta]MOY22606.1 immunoglobulin heavy chain junction region [Macaca mulatta]MOY23333.1 immunoglobulin heavy chain junction region [Macaca mulatta]MOY23678.1 immunoglobulin heavy chain junction region [Macaca mulatta]